MSTKEWIYEQDNPEEFSIAKTEFSEQFTVSIPAETFDKIAFAWCLKRKLQGELGGPVGLEFGSPDSPYK